MDKETREFLERKFNAIDNRFDKVDRKFDAIDGKFEDVKRHADQKFEENKRYFGVVAEGLRNEIRQVAEGHQVLLDGQARIIDRLGQVEKELGAMIKFSYAELDQRIRVLEGKFQTLNDRLDRLETLQS